MRQLAIHSHHVRCVAYSPDGTLLATASNDRSVRLLEVSTGRQAASWSPGWSVMQALAFSPDGTTLAFGGQQSQLWLARVGEPATSLRSADVPFVEPEQAPAYPAHVSALAYTPDGRCLLVGVGDRILSIPRGALHVWSAGSLQAERHVRVPGGLQSLAVRGDGKQVALGTGNGWEVGWVGTWGFGGLSNQGRSGMAVAYSPDGRLLAIASGWSILLQEVEGDRRIVRTLTGHKGKIPALAFTPDGQRLLSGSWDRTARLWSPHTGQQLASFDWGRGKVQYVAVAPDGMTAAAGMDRGVVIWDLD